MDDRLIQRLLTAAGYYNGGIDGDYGPKSVIAEGKVLQRNKPEALGWSSKRRKNAAAQIILKATGYYTGDIDGYAGHLTQEAANAWDYYVTYGRPEVLPGREAPAGPPVAPVQSGARWPSQKAVQSFYGEPGGPQCTQGKVILPFAFKLAWNKNALVRSFSCHVKCEEAFTTIWRDAAQHYGEERFRELGLDLYGGCFNFRPMRGGTSLSMHSWGIAQDVDPDRNQLRWGRDRAHLAREDYNAFWRIVAAQGGISLGRERNYDWMHFQFATL